MSNARITFVMATYNRADLIAESITPILDQMGPHDRLVVVDDGSTDDTPQVLARFGDRITAQRIANRGKSGALNHALRSIDSEWIWICDDDDLLTPGSVDALVGFAEQRGADFAFGRYVRFTDEDGRRTMLPPGYWPDLSSGSIERHLLEDFFIFQQASLVRQRLYAQAGPFEESFPRSIDYEMILRLVRYGAPQFLDYVIFEQRAHAGARGPATARHSADQMEAVWMDTDRRLFQPMLGPEGLDRVRAMFEGGEAWERERAALLQRATILIRHALFDQGCDDLDMAAALHPKARLSALECGIAHRALSGKFGATRLPAPALTARLRRLSAHGALGRSLQREIVAGAMWRLRSGNAAYSRSQAALMRGVLKPWGMLAVIAASLAGKAGIAPRSRRSGVREVDPRLLS